MINKQSNLSIRTAILFELILVITAISNIASKQFKHLVPLLLIIVCIALPFFITYISNKKKIVLPSSFQLITLLFILLTLYFGEFMKFYTIFWWWDLFLHGMFGSYTVIVALHLIRGIIIKEKSITEKRFVIFTLIFAFSFTIALGTLWEMFEFLSDYFFKTDTVNGGLEDTATDLLIKIFFAFITCLIYYHRKLKSKR